MQRLYKNITPMEVSLSGTIDQKTYLKKFRGGFSLLSPPPRGSAYAFTFVLGGLDIENLTKTPLIYIVSYFNPPRGQGRSRGPTYMFILRGDFSLF